MVEMFPKIVALAKIVARDERQETRELCSYASEYFERNVCCGGCLCCCGTEIMVVVGGHSLVILNVGWLAGWLASWPGAGRIASMAQSSWNAAKTEFQFVRFEVKLRLGWLFSATIRLFVRFDHSLAFQQFPWPSSILPPFSHNYNAAKTEYRFTVSNYFRFQRQTLCQVCIFCRYRIMLEHYYHSSCIYIFLYFYIYIYSMVCMYIYSRRTTIIWLLIKVWAFASRMVYTNRRG